MRAVAPHDTQATGRRYRPYPRYKDSGVEWLGEVPEHWSSTAVKRRFDVQLGKMLQNNPASEADVLSPYIKALHVHWGRVDTSDLPQMWASPTDIQQYGVKKGDLLVCEGGEAGRAGIISSVPSPCIIQNAVHRVRGNGAATRFLLYVLHAVSSRGWFDVLCNKATIAHFTREKLAELQIPLPATLEVQRTIAAFLDRETARIDALIEKKERQIDLLQEKRVAVISHAVTKGLGANVKMKDSGVEWLGEIPEHWQVLAIKFALAMPITDGPHETPEFLPDGIPFLSAESVKDDRLDFTRKRGFISEEDHARFSKKYVPKRGDVYMVKSGATTGNVARVESDEVFNIWSPLAVLRPHPARSVTDFIFYFMKSRAFLASVELAWSYGTQQNIGMGVVSNLRIALPPLEEQKSIAAMLNTETARIDTLIKKIRASVDKLHECRTALISAAVTGKIDVRSLPAPQSEAARQAGEVA